MPRREPVQLWMRESDHDAEAPVRVVGARGFELEEPPPEQQTVVSRESGRADGLPEEPFHRRQGERSAIRAREADPSGDRGLAGLEQ